ncbi:hypothetical protein M409DRAFT_26779 [Zasmidium cellare ATCC 36951]|uniref:Uncharacterized protein n=1 Tax=Zasmidium cellare ATCC 36951 TaxID=1080233 RepID=A0A6A6CBS7_ZASCE|nr:uncharacterized protein M409DRAFT_26779 [Zasmidium cellare ATCC 36951]KAF2162926.1 hypothetical protein M409DRAFT_26779 [Zasmidium cellare ATCC 36951]
MTSLITAFTPAPSCFAPTYTVAPSGNDTVANLTAIRGYATECMPSPPQATGYPTIHAVNCFPGYHQVAGSLGRDESSTYGTCCPSGMTIHSTASQMCSSITGYNSVTVVNATQTSAVHANFLVAPAMVMAWNSQDLVGLTASRSVEVIPSPTGQSVETGADHLPKADTVRYKVVLAICVAIGCLVGIGLVAALIAFVLARRRQRMAAAAAAKDMPPAYEARSSESSEELPGYLAGAREEKFDVK